MRQEYNIKKEAILNHKKIIDINKIFLSSLKKELQLKKIKNNIKIQEDASNPLTNLLYSNLKSNNQKIAKKYLNSLLNITNKNKKKELFKSKKFPSIYQNKLLIDLEETRNHKLILDKSISIKEVKKIYKLLNKLEKYLGKEWFNLIKVIKFMTIIKIKTKSNTNNFSGTSTNSLGAIHFCKPFTEIKLLECVTHEASHIWLDRLECSGLELAKNGWTQNKFRSPWRDDKRPISGIIHAVYVFSKVCIYLIKYYKKTKNLNALRRIIYLSSKINSGLNILKKCDSIYPLGKKVNNISHNYYKEIYRFVQQQV